LQALAGLHYLLKSWDHCFANSLHLAAWPSSILDRFVAAATCYTEMVNQTMFSQKIIGFRTPIQQQNQHLTVYGCSTNAFKLSHWCFQTFEPLTFHTPLICSTCSQNKFHFFSHIAFIDKEGNHVESGTLWWWWWYTFRV
jgi:hypothetical protein